MLNDADKKWIKAVIAEAARDVYLALADGTDWGGPINADIKRPYNLKALAEAGTGSGPTAEAVAIKTAAEFAARLQA